MGLRGGINGTPHEARVGAVGGVVDRARGGDCDFRSGRDSSAKVTELWGVEGWIKPFVAELTENDVGSLREVGVGKPFLCGEVVIVASVESKLRRSPLAAGDIASEITPSGRFGDDCLANGRGALVPNSACGRRSERSVFEKMKADPIGISEAVFGISGQAFLESGGATVAIFP